MSRRRRVFGVVSLIVMATASSAVSQPIKFTSAERQLILLHGPWPQKTSPDPSNRFSGRGDAIALGQALFHSTLLSRDRDQSCATCHRRDMAFADGKKRPRGVARVDRNTQSLANLRLIRWFGWAGQTDSLWAQSIRPILDPRELALSADELKRRVIADAATRKAYRRVVGGAPISHPAEAVLVNIGKILAAYQETLVTGRTPFDAFRDALAAGDRAGIVAYPQSAKRGLRLFIGRGRCSACHFGPNFTNGEFHNIGVVHFVGAKGKGRRVDPGRYGGIRSLRRNRFNLLGPYNDDPAKRTAGFTRRVRLHPRNWGEFRVPSLRNVARTAPYMHAGSHPTLESVVRHYSAVPENRLHQGRARLLKPLNLTPGQIGDMVAFLITLTSRR